MQIYLFGQVPVGKLSCGMKLGFLKMESLKSHNQFLLGLGINSDNQNSLMYIQVICEHWYKSRSSVRWLVIGEYQHTSRTSLSITYNWESVSMDIHPSHWWALTYIQVISEHWHTSKTLMIIDIHPDHWWASTYIQDISEHQHSSRTSVSINIHPSHVTIFPHSFGSRRSSLFFKGWQHFSFVGSEKFVYTFSIFLISKKITFLNFLLSSAV